MKLKMRDLKDTLRSIWNKTVRYSKAALDFAIDYSLATLLIISIMYGTLRAPEFYNHWIRSSVGSKVYMIRDSVLSGGGTGFAIKAPSGASYILTNDHVCAVSSDKQTVLVSDDDDNMMRRRIIAHDEYSDLCLIEGLPGVEGLEVATFNPSLGENVTVVGHPRLFPLTVSKGEMIGKEDVDIFEGPIAVMNPNTGEWEQIPVDRGGVDPKQCMMAKHSQPVIDLQFFWLKIRVKFCVWTVKDAYMTTAVIHGGNSGSPVVNFWGNVTSVAFAADDTNWGRMVPLKDIKRFLKHY